MQQRSAALKDVKKHKEDHCHTEEIDTAADADKASVSEKHESTKASNMRQISKNNRPSNECFHYKKSCLPYTCGKEGKDKLTSNSNHSKVPKSLEAINYIVKMVIELVNLTSR